MAPNGAHANASLGVQTSSTTKDAERRNPRVRIPHTGSTHPRACVCAHDLFMIVGTRQFVVYTINHGRLTSRRRRLPSLIRRLRLTRTRVRTRAGVGGRGMMVTGLVRHGAVVMHLADTIPRVGRSRVEPYTSSRARIQTQMHTNGRQNGKAKVSEKKSVGFGWCSIPIKRLLCRWKCTTHCRCKGHGRG